MKFKYIIFLILPFLILISCKKTISNEYVISGQITNNTEKVILIKERVDSLGWYTQDTINVMSDGSFTFTNNIDTLSVASIILSNNLRSSQFFIDKNEQLGIEGDFNHPELWQISGSILNNKINEFNKSIGNELEEISQIKDSIRQLDNDSLNKTGILLDLRNKEFEISNKVSEYVKENPSDITSVLLINKYFKNETSIERLSDALKLLKGKALDFSLSAQLTDFENFMKSFSKGATAPLIESKDINDKLVKLNELRSQFVVITFVSSENKEFENTYSEINKMYLKLKPGKTIKTTRNNKTFNEKVLYNVKFMIVVKDTEEYPIDTKKLNKDIMIIPAHNGWSNQLFIDYNVNQTPISFLINTYGRIEELNFSLSTLQSTLDNVPRGLKEIVKK